VFVRFTSDGNGPTDRKGLDSNTKTHRTTRRRDRNKGGQRSGMETTRAGAKRGVEPHNACTAQHSTAQSSAAVPAEMEEGKPKGLERTGQSLTSVFPKFLARQQQQNKRSRNSSRTAVDTARALSLSHSPVKDTKTPHKRWTQPTGSRPNIKGERGTAHETDGAYGPGRRAGGWMDGLNELARTITHIPGR
jgi:hypothetical protein